MTNDLDDLLRTTLRGRAGTVTTGPAWEGAQATRRPRGPWIAAAAAAVTVLGVAGGIAYLSPGSDGTATQTGGNATAACRTTLPSEWRRALQAPPVSIDGKPAYAQAITPDGRVVAEWIGSDHVDHVALLPRSGKPVELDQHPGNRLYDRYDADDSHAVLSSSRKYPVNNPDSPTDDIVVVDLATRRRTHIFSAAPIPRGWIVTTGAVVQNGYVYLAIAPRAHNPTHGEILRYDIATATFSRIARVSGTYPEIDHDARGVGWPGGSVPAKSAPSGLPPFFSTDRSGPVVSDGHAAAWTQSSDPFVVRWTSGDGEFRAFTVRLRASRDPEFTPEVDAVSGPFVALWTNDTGDPISILDTRTGAFAQTDSRAEQMFSSGNTLVFGSSELGVLRVDVSSLPELRC